MKTKVFIFLFVMACTTAFGQVSKGEKEWLKSYKQAVFHAGLLKGLKNPKLAKELAVSDNSFYDPVFSFLHIKSIEKTSDYLLGLIEKDYVDRKGKVAEPAEGKRTLLICLDFYTSRTLDNIARKEYQNWIKDPKREERLKEANKMY